MNVLNKLRPMINAAVDSLATTKFKIDPIAGKGFSRGGSLIGSMQKKHGLILEKAIFEAVSESPHYSVWTTKNFKVSSDVNSAVSGVNKVKRDPDWLHLTGNEYPYGQEASLQQIDLIAYNQKTKVISAVEIKRGYSHHDAGKKKTILKAALSVQMLLKSYGEAELGPNKIVEARSRICNYYKEKEFHSSIMFDKDYLDDFFEIEVLAKVEEVNNYYRKRFHSMMGEQAP